MPRKQIRLGRRRTEKKQPRHPGVQTLRPSRGQPHWRLAWRDPDPAAPLGKDGKPRWQREPVRLDPLVLKAANEDGSVPDEVRRAAHAKFLALQTLVAPRPKLLAGTTRTLLVERNERIANGKTKGGRGSRYANPTLKLIRRGIDLLNAFAVAHGCMPPVSKEEDPINGGYVRVGDLLKRVCEDPARHGPSCPGEHTLVRAWWLSLGERMGDGSRMALVKHVRAILLRARYITVSEAGRRVFDGEQLRDELPVHAVQPAKGPPRMREGDTLRTLLRAAIEHQRKPAVKGKMAAADIGLMLCDGLRLAEQSYLRVGHCRIDKQIEGGKATYIVLPDKLDADKSINHAKGGQGRNISLTAHVALRRPLSPLGAELLKALCANRQPHEWVMSYTYRGLGRILGIICSWAGLDPITPHVLRAINANVTKLIVGAAGESEQLGHGQKEAVTSYMDREWQDQIRAKRPKSIEAALGIEQEMQEIIALVKKSPREWGNEHRYIPYALSGESLAGMPGAGPSMRSHPSEVRRNVRRLPSSLPHQPAAQYE